MHITTERNSNINVVRQNGTGWELSSWYTNVDGFLYFLNNVTIHVIRRILVTVNSQVT